MRNENVEKDAEKSKITRIERRLIVHMDKTSKQTGASANQSTTEDAHCP